MKLEAEPKPKIKDRSQPQKHWNYAIYLLVVVTLSRLILVFKLCFCTALPCPKEDYNTVVETAATKKELLLNFGLELILLANGENL